MNEKQSPSMSSVVQIKELQSQRPKPVVEQHFTPGGSIEEYTHTEQAQKKNAEITKRVNEMEACLERTQGKAREAFENVRRGFVRNRFNRKGRGDSGRSR